MVKGRAGCVFTNLEDEDGEFQFTAAKGLYNDIHADEMYWRSTGMSWQSGKHVLEYLVDSEGVRSGVRYFHSTLGHLMFGKRLRSLMTTEPRARRVRCGNFFEATDLSYSGG